ncbi:hypothetical protein pdam_00024098 [Pocillopora damicornis]|uniref:EGF-like domain-containing protein n=1 Tax=Pocillopora damicornis TaxID=46731 RepID=A0A3M6V380_POCDA|nr:hypothetical protein pdam_00024098 [Pocillopora damicornis]
MPNPGTLSALIAVPVKLVLLEMEYHAQYRTARLTTSEILGIALFNILWFEFLDKCRKLAFPSTLFFVGERLVNHTIANIRVIDRDTCGYRCYLDHNCVSVNFYFGENEAEAHNYELNNSTSKEFDKGLVKAANFVYYGTKNFCAQSPCENYGTCQSGFIRKRYRCLCASGFNGHDCEKDINECTNNTHNCSRNNANCTKIVGSYNCSCNPGFTGDGHICQGKILHSLSHY